MQLQTKSNQEQTYVDLSDNESNANKFPHVGQSKSVIRQIMICSLLSSIEVLSDELIYIEETETDETIKTILMQNIRLCLKNKYHNIQLLKEARIRISNFGELMIKGWNYHT